MTLNKVDLPQPEGPITPTNSPGATLSETWSTAVSTPSDVSKRLTMSSTTSRALAGAAFGAPASARSNGTVTAAIAFHHPRFEPSVCRGRLVRCWAQSPPYSTSRQRVSRRPSEEIMSLGPALAESSGRPLDMDLD